MRKTCSYCLWRKIPIDSVLVVVLKVESVKKKCTLRARGYIIAAGASILSNKAARNVDRLWGRSLVRTPIHNSRRNMGDPCAYQLSLRAIAAGPPSVPSLHSLQRRTRLQSHIWPVLTTIAFNHEMGLRVRVVQALNFCKMH